MPELLYLLASVDRVQNWPNALPKYSVRECFIWRLLDLQKPLYAFLCHLLYTSLISLEVLEEDANDFRLYLYHVEVEVSLQATGLEVLLQKLLVVWLLPCRVCIGEEFLLPVSELL